MLSNMSYFVPFSTFLCHTQKLIIRRTIPLDLYVYISKKFQNFQGKPSIPYFASCDKRCSTANYKNFIIFISLFFSIIPNLIRSLTDIISESCTHLIINSISSSDIFPMYKRSSNLDEEI